MIKLLLLTLVSVAPAMILSGQATLIYSNDFNGPVGLQYPEWASSVISYRSTASPPGSGELPAPLVTNTESPNGSQRFLGELGGPAIGKPGNPGYNHTRVDQTISLTLTNLPAHRSLTLAFDLYVLKSWDGNSPAYGPDRFRVNIADGPALLDTTFSNNPKIKTDGSLQNYPYTNSPPWSGAAATNTLGYNNFFCDATYRLQYTFPHTASVLRINFSSSLFEGKGTADESWGLDNVSVRTGTLFPSK
jgi:hypothetical protein